MSTARRDLLSLFTRRTLVLGMMGASGLGAIGARLIYLQTLDPGLKQTDGDNEQHLTYEKLAQQNRFDTQFVPPPRGMIYDRFGERLAITSRDYRVMVTPEQTTDLEGTIRAVGALIGLSEAAIRARLRDARGKPRFEVTLLGQGLTWEQFSAVNVRLPELPGVVAEAGEQRFYPYMSAFAHPIGYVQRPADRDVARVIEAERARLGLPQDVAIDPPRARYLRHPEARVGRVGLEAGLESMLQGEPGLKKVEVNAQGRVVSEVTREERPVRAGDGIVLTLDAELQRAAMERLGGESGSAVVIDIHSGDILALASAPGFDPNLFTNGISGPAFRMLNEDPYKPLFHKSVKGAYKPGSTFKIVTGLAAMAAGLKPTDRFSCPGHFTFGGRRFHCWKRGGHGSVDFRTAVKVSCNVFFYNAALRAGPERIAEFGRALGMETAFDIGIPRREIEAGIMPDPDWFRRVRKAPWPAGNTLNTGIGQGDILATPLQLAVITARVANGGKAIAPRLVREAAGLRDLGEPADLRLDPGMVAATLEALSAVCNEPGGTAFGSCRDLQLVRDPADGRIIDASQGAPAGALPVQMAGKTGTAQVRVITAAERARGVRSNEDLPWPLRDHAVFVFFAPVDQPRYAGAVLIEHGGGGGRIAAPIGRDIARATLLRDPAGRKAATLAQLRDPGASPA